MKKGRLSEGSLSVRVCCGVCLICAALIKPVQDRVESRLGGFGQVDDLLYFSSPAAVRKMALGYDSLAADFYWMRAIQYYGRRDEADKRPVRYKNLSTLLDIATTLNPDLLDAYRSGSSFLAEPDPVGAGQPSEAIKLLDKGIREHPRDWRLLYDKGFIYFWFLKNFKTAGEIWLSAGRLPEAPHWLEGLAAMAFSKGGGLRVAVSIWERQLKESNQASIRENARNHLLSVQVARDLWTLEALVERHKQKHGYFPRNLRDTVRAQSRPLPLADPLGTPYQYDPETGSVGLAPESKVVYLEIPESYRPELRMTNDE
jgi:tetratricopeptide (TPR) repeat protein